MGHAATLCCVLATASTLLQVEGLVDVGPEPGTGVGEFKLFPEVLEVLEVPESAVHEAPRAPPLGLVTAQAPEPTLAPQAAQTEHLQLCLTDIYPVEALSGMGVPAEVAGTIASFAQHAQVVLGESSANATSVSWEVQIDKSDAYWQTTIMGVAQGLRGMSAQPVADQVAWARGKATAIQGATKLTVSAPAAAWSKAGAAPRCYRSPAPSSCSREEIDRLALAYKEQHPAFSLNGENCALFACHIVASCASELGACDAVACRERLSASAASKDKAPGCGLVAAEQPRAAASPDRPRGSQVGGMPLQPQPQGVQPQPQSVQPQPQSVQPQPQSVQPQPQGAMVTGQTQDMLASPWMGWWAQAWKPGTNALASPTLPTLAWPAVGG